MAGEGGRQSVHHQQITCSIICRRKAELRCHRERKRWCPARAGEPARGKRESVPLQINLKILLRLPTRQCKFGGNIVALFRVNRSTCDCLALAFTPRQESRKNNEDPFPSLARKFSFKLLPSFSNCS